MIRFRQVDNGIRSSAAITGDSAMTHAFVLGGTRTPFARYGVIGACIGSGQGIPLVIEDS
jgi:hypothetical protein